MTCRLQATGSLMGTSCTSAFDREEKQTLIGSSQGEMRISQVSIFNSLQTHLKTVDFSLLLADVMTIADEVNSQLKQTLLVSQSQRWVLPRELTVAVVVSVATAMEPSKLVSASRQ
jgi:hypothetical protein